MRVEDVLSCDSDVVSGAVVFKGSRVPVEAFFVNISIEDFLDNDPTISREEVEAVLRLAVECLKSHFPNRSD